MFVKVRYEGGGLCPGQNYCRACKYRNKHTFRDKSMAERMRKNRLATYVRVVKKSHLVAFVGSGKNHYVKRLHWSGFYDGQSSPLV